MMIVAVPKTNRAHIDEVLRPCWIDWVDGIDGFEPINVDVPITMNGHHVEMLKPIFLTGSRLGGLKPFVENSTAKMAS